jgi:tetratricopeptide (TPR) repeat protein
MSVTTLSAQDKKLQVSEMDMNGVVFREAGDNETVVEVKSNIKLEFESTMDRAVSVHKTYEESGFFFYELLFSTDKKYKGRKLKIKSFGFDTHTQPLDLKAKIPVGLLVIDPNSEVGAGCYFEHLNKGNKFFENTQYADAKTEYYLALECSDMPEDNDLSKKIDDTGAALDSKRIADDYYNAGKYIEAKQEYEKLHGLNPNDKYPAERITVCDIRIPNLPRTVRVKVADANKRLMSGVTISAEFFNTDKTGNIIRDKDGKPKKVKWKALSTTTNQQGECIITVKMENKILKFYKYKDGKTEYSAQVQIPATTDEIEVILSETATIETTITTVANALNNVLEGLPKK